MSTKQVNVTISNKTLLRVIGAVVLTILAFNFISRILHPLTLIFISFYLALALNPIVSWLTKRLPSKSRLRASAVAYVSVVFILIGFFSLIIPPLFDQTRDFVRDVPQTVENFRNQDSGLAALARDYNIDVQLGKIADSISTSYNQWANQAISTGKRVGSAFISIIVVLVLTFMMLVEGPHWLNRFWELMPPGKRERQKRTATKMYNSVTAFVNGQVLLAIIGGFFATMAILIASSIMNVSVNAVALGGIVALFALIPMIGNVISATIVVIICMLSSFGLGLVLLAYFLIYQQIENATLQPYIQSRQNELSPLIVFVAALLGIGFGGIIGALVAIPVASSLKILFDDYLKEKIAEYNLRTAKKPG